MSIQLQPAEPGRPRPRMTVIGVGGAGGNAVNNMIQAGVADIEFVAANTDAQELSMSIAGVRLQMGLDITEGLGAGLNPEIGAAAAEDALEEIRTHLSGVQILFITAGMGGGTGTGAAPVIARAAKDMGILTLAVVTKPFKFEGRRRMKHADRGITELASQVDTVLVIPNQNLFRVANKTTTFADAFERANDVLRSAVSCITDLMTEDGLIYLDPVDIKAVMQKMGTIMIGAHDSDSNNGAPETVALTVSTLPFNDVPIGRAEGLITSIIGNQDRIILCEAQEAAELARGEIAAHKTPSLNAEATAHHATSPGTRSLGPAHTGSPVWGDRARSYGESKPDPASDGYAGCVRHRQPPYQQLSLAQAQANVQRPAVRDAIKDGSIRKMARRMIIHCISSVQRVVATTSALVGYNFSPYRHGNRNATKARVAWLNDLRRIAVRRQIPAASYLTCVCLLASVWYFL